MREVEQNKLDPRLSFARYIDITPEYDFNGIIAYDARMLSVISGRGELFVDGERYRLEPGTLICWQAGSEYGFYEITQSPIRVIMLNFDFTRENGAPALRRPDIPGSFDPSRIEDFAAFREYADRAGVFIDHDAFYAEPLMRELVDEYNAQRVCWENVSCGIITLLLGKLVRAMRLGGTRDRREELISYIGEHFGEPLTYDSLGKIFSYHPNHISRMIVRSTGMPLHRYLLRVRIKRAYGMLCDEGRTVTETAKLCGFSDSASFSKRFRLETGLTPSEVAKRPRA